MMNKKYCVTIRTVTGLHIGKGKELVQIGGIDQEVIKTRDELPYIPASSLKGKLRSLVETAFNKSKNGKVCACDEADCKVCRFFGSAGKREQDQDSARKRGPTRLIFRDLSLTPSSKEMLIQDASQGIRPYEEKMEVTINRHTGVGEHPRPLERVPPDITFQGELLVRIMDSDVEEAKAKDAKLKSGEKKDGAGKESLALHEHHFGKNFAKFKELLELDYLGGSGSRGSGQVEINFEPASCSEVNLKKDEENNIKSA